MTTTPPELPSTPLLEPDLAARRARLSAAWRPLLDGRRGTDLPLIFLCAGDVRRVPGRQDRAYPFFAHSHYYWLTDRNRPLSVLAYDPADDEWIDFVVPVAEAERVWEGLADTGGSAAAQAIERPLASLSDWLAAKTQGGERLMIRLGETDPGWPDAVPWVAIESGGTQFEQQLIDALDAARRPKDSSELSRMQAAVAATAAGFATIAASLEPLQSEREIQVRLEAATFAAGSAHHVRSMAYDSIVGSGPNAAVLHFAPSNRRTREGECLLIDAGGECLGYAADVTRTLAVGGRFEGGMADIYAIVREAQIAAVDACRPGKEFRELHLDTALAMTRGLQHLGILRAGDPQGLVDRDAHALFFPHGLGHLVGLGVRDASGYLPGRARSDRFGLNALRQDLPLQPGYVTTIEPGLYFIPPLLTDPARRAAHADDIDWDTIDRIWLKNGISAGGVRIEDNILITDAEPTNLTAAIPK